MAAPYLNQIRLDEPAKSEIRSIMHDVADRFDVHGATRNRPVPHVTLFGPYNTDRGLEAKNRAQSVLSSYRIVPFEITGFGSFSDDVIYASVDPSQELRSLRQDLASQLLPISYNFQDHDLDTEYQFHITIAYKDIQDQFDDILGYLRDNYELNNQLYAKRVSSLHKRDLMWEWDIPRKKELSSNVATSKSSWQQTDSELQRLLKDGAQGTAQSYSDQISRYIKKLVL